MSGDVDQVVQCFQKWLYLPKPEALLAVLGAVAANRMAGDPVWLLVVGPPGGGKSEILQAILGVPDTHAAATVTERALLSGTARKERDANAKGGLLREIGSYGIVVCKDFGSLLSMHRDERSRTLAALREVYDGSWTRHVGVDGGRTLHWAGKVGLIAGCTPTIDSHHAVMGAMGERFVLLRLPQADNTAQARKALSHVGYETQMRHELADSVKTLFANAQTTPRELTEPERDRLIALSTVVVRCRSSVERDGYNKREILLVPGSEAPTRLIIVLANLLAGLDIIGVERHKAWEVVTQIALDSMPRLRHDIVTTLYDTHEPEATPDISGAVRHPVTTTRRALEDLTAHYVLEHHPQGKGKSSLWTLADWTRRSLNEALKALPEPKPGGAPEKSYPIDTTSAPETSHPPTEDLLLNPRTYRTTNRAHPENGGVPNYTDETETARLIDLYVHTDEDTPADLEPAATRDDDIPF